MLETTTPDGPLAGIATEYGRCPGSHETKSSPAAGRCARTTSSAPGARLRPGPAPVPGSAPPTTGAS